MKDFTKENSYRLSLPDPWMADEDENPVAIYQRDGAGALQVTAESFQNKKKGDRIDAFLAMRSFMKTTGQELNESASKRYSRNDLDWAYTEYEGESTEGKVYWRLWFATNHDVLAFLTYACRVEDREKEHALVDSIVDSLVLF